MVSIGTSKLGPIGAQMILSIQINFKKRTPKQQEILLRNSEAGGKIRKSRILSITTQSIIFFLSLLVHNVSKAISSLFVLNFFSRHLTAKCCFEIADYFTTETSVIIKFLELTFYTGLTQSRLENFDCIYILFDN